MNEVRNVGQQGVVTNPNHQSDGDSRTQAASSTGSQDSENGSTDQTSDSFTLFARQRSEAPLSPKPILPKPILPNPEKTVKTSAVLEPVPESVADTKKESVQGNVDDAKKETDSLLNFFDVDLEHTRGPGPVDNSYKDLETKAETTDGSSFGDSAVKALKAAQSVAYKIIKDL